MCLSFLVCLWVCSSVFLSLCLFVSCSVCLLLFPFFPLSLSLSLFISFLSFSLSLLSRHLSFRAFHSVSLTLCSIPLSIYFPLFLFPTSSSSLPYNHIESVLLSASSSFWFHMYSYYSLCSSFFANFNSPFSSSIFHFVLPFLVFLSASPFHIIQHSVA